MSSPSYGCAVVQHLLWCMLLKTTQRPAEDVVLHPETAHDAQVMNEYRVVCCRRVLPTSTSAGCC